MSTQTNLYTVLPENYIPNSNLKDPKQYIVTILKKELPSSDVKKISSELQRVFYLEKIAASKKEPKPIRRKKTFLTRKERKQLDLLKLPKTDWNYKLLEPLRIMWRQYMRENLDLIINKVVPNCEDTDWNNFSTIVARSELIGAELTVVRSKVVTQVGISGTVVLESKMTFQIVTAQSQLKTLVKASSVFEFNLDKLKFTVFGKHLLTKPAEKSTKKIKAHMLPDL